MTLRLFNTLSRTVEPFAPLAPPRVTLYTCGPTVWNYAHLGNFRTFVFEDVLRRYLEYSGYDVLHVMNLTDVDDRTINAARAAGVPLQAHTRPFAQAFFEDGDYLRIKPAHHYPAATAHVPQMVELVSRLLARGVAYRGDDGSVYFAIDRFPAYGRLSRVERRDLKAGARVSSDEYAKEDARDFVLWKAARPEDEAVGAAWDAPFGRGRPGWHLECSAMARHYLGDTLDIHAGGVDLVFPHHEDEIAQSEAATGRPFARFWLHGEHLLVAGTKMSKRYGNFLTARDLRDDGWDAAAVRYLFAATHYRKQLNFTDEALSAAAAGAQRLAEFRERLLSAPSAPPGRVADLARHIEQAFEARMDDDLDVAGAIGGIMTMVREVNAEIDLRGGMSVEERQTFLAALDRVTEVLQVVPAAEAVPEIEVTAGPMPAMEAALGGALPAGPGPGEDLRAWATRMAELRVACRRLRRWDRADLVRRLLEDQGFEVRDTRDGVRLVPGRRTPKGA
ncbi:MAG: cysteine--tRNA ligase [Gemmatimonadetes bacterium]|nr:cysteine--tRNA ligase [Gemmatimonadota bacterium]